jgi:alkanesulfonate monooxygenase SsuD/methylene tetrahydromethanopterin reductase-like flavin-dependent oxidoreductase (luciferase family)
VVAQAAATSAVLHDGRFVLGVVTGEAFNEHITGTRWLSADERPEMLEEAVPRSTGAVGRQVRQSPGQYFTVE